jgi:hypothetical protein
MMMIIDNKRYRERGEELKVLHYASAAATRNRNLRQFAGNLWQIAGTILSHRYSLLTLIYSFNLSPAFIAYSFAY